MTVHECECESECEPESECEFDATGFSDTVHVGVDKDTAVGTYDLPFDPIDLFHNTIPTAYCAVQGFVSKVDLDRSQRVSR